jgi:outer membrane biosynthesis protein TonB
MNWDNKAFLFTTSVYTLVLFLFLFFGFTTPLPLPAEQGILINFGEDETGSGFEEPKPAEEIAEQLESAQPTAVNSEEVQEQLTQDYEEAPAVVPVQQKTQKPKQETKPVKKPQEEVKKVEKPAVNQNALYKGKKTNSESTGSEGEVGGAGNQGSITGDTEVTNHSLGAGIGDGISFSLSGRSPLSLPTPRISTQETGWVVVTVRVDRSGKVIFAEPGAKGSTTLNKDLLAAAKKAALASKFNNKSDAPLIQEGTITYVFVVN